MAFLEKAEVCHIRHARLAELWSVTKIFRRIAVRNLCLFFCVPPLDPHLSAPPVLPALRRLLSRANQTLISANSQEEALCALFGESLSSNPPCAALSAAADGLGTGSAYWLRADPIHLQPRRDDLVAMEITDLRDEDAHALLQSANALLADDGFQFILGASNRWYLRLASNPGITTTPLSKAIGHGINPYLPKGEQASSWQRRLTEIQMLFHTHAVNEKRDEQNQLAVSGLWLWGGGSLANFEDKPFGTVYGSDILAKGLALCSGAKSLPLCERFEQLAKEDNALVMLAPASALSQLEQRWFTPLLESLRKRKIGQCDIVVWNGVARRYRLGPKDLWRFWRLDAGRDFLAADA